MRKEFSNNSQAALSVPRNKKRPSVETERPLTIACHMKNRS